MPEVTQLRRCEARTWAQSAASPAPLTLPGHGMGRRASRTQEGQCRPAGSGRFTSRKPQTRLERAVRTPAQLGAPDSSQGLAPAVTQAQETAAPTAPSAGLVVTQVMLPRGAWWLLLWAAPVAALAHGG